MSINPEHLAGHAWVWTELFVLLILAAVLIFLFASTLLARWIHQDPSAQSSDARVASIELIIATLAACFAIVWWHYGLGRVIKSVQAQNDYAVAVGGLVYYHAMAVLGAVLVVAGYWRASSRTGWRRLTSVGMAILGLVALVVVTSIQL